MKHVTRFQTLLAGAFLIILFFTVLTAWFVIAARTVRIFDIQKTELILKNDGCNLLKMKGIDTKAVEFGNGCSAAVPYLKNMYGNGGVIFLDGNQITISDDLVVSTGAIEDIPWNQIHSEALILMIISTVLLALTIRIFVIILKKSNEK